MRIVSWSGLAVAIAACSGPSRPPPPQIPVADDPPRVAPVQGTPKAIETPMLVSAPLPGDPTRTTIHRLSNGMTVYLSPDSQVPTIAAHIAVRAGGRHDPEQSTGLAHYLEHMLFKGTSTLGTLDYQKEKPHLDRIASLYAELRKPEADRGKVLAAIDAETQAAAAYAIPNELDRLYSRIGITGLNAYTTNDATVYTVELPRNRVAQWARVDAQRFADPVFRLFWPELEAVYEEKNSALDEPAERVYDAFMKALFPEHGYGWGGSVLGEVEHLKAPAYQDMEAFFQRYYTPGNMAILLAGDVDTSVLPLLEKEFGALRRPAGEAVAPGKLTKLAARTELEVPVPTDEGVLLIWPAVAATHPDALAIELMERVLLDGDYGILARELLITQKVATARSGASLFREAGYFELVADALDGQTHAELEKLLLGLVDKLQRGDFTDTDVATAVLTYDVARQQQLETNDGRIELLTNAFVLGEDWRAVIAKVDRMRALTKADIVRVAKQYLTKEHLAVKKVKRTTTLPKITKPGITPVKLDASRQTVYAKSIAAMPVTPIDPVAVVEGADYKRGTLPTGEVITVRNKRNELFALTYDYDFGRGDDRLACIAIDSFAVVGAGTRSADAIAQQLHALAVSVETSCAKDWTRVTVSGPDRNLEAALALVRDRLASPAIDVAGVKARIATVLTERANALESPQAIQTAQQHFAWYGADSEELVVAPNRQLQAMTPAQLKKLISRFLDLKHRTTYFGPRSHEAALAVIALGDGKLATKPPRPTRYRKPNAVFATTQATAQTHISVVWPRKPTTEAERATGAVFSEYAGMLLYQEVREARGLAYTVYGAYDSGDHQLDDASIYVYAGVQGDKTHDALDAVLATLRSPLDDTRLAHVREAIAQRHRIERISPRELGGQVYRWLDQGEKSDPRAGRVHRTLAVDRRALEQWLAGALAQPVIVSLTGERKHVVDAKLKGLAPLTWVPVAKLFGY